MEKRQIFWPCGHSNPGSSISQNSHYTEMSYPNYYWFRVVQHAVEITAWLRLFHTAVNWAVEHWYSFTSNGLPSCRLLTFIAPLRHNPLHLIQIKCNFNILYRTAPSCLRAYLFSPNSTTKSVAAFDFRQLLFEWTVIFMLSHQFEGRSQNCGKCLLASLRPSIRLSARPSVRPYFRPHRTRL